MTDTLYSPNVKSNVGIRLLLKHIAHYDVVIIINYDTRVFIECRRLPTRRSAHKTIKNAPPTDRQTTSELCPEHVIEAGFTVGY